MEHRQGFAKFKKASQLILDPGRGEELPFKKTKQKHLFFRGLHVINVWSKVKLQDELTEERHIFHLQRDE